MALDQSILQVVRVSLATVFLRRSIMQATVAMTPIAGGLGYGGDMIDLRTSLPSSGQYPTRDMEQVTTLVIHHTATRATGWGPINDFHRNAKGWSRIGYHFGASWDGRIFWLNDINRLTNQCGGCNSHTVGLAMLGNYDEDEPTKELKDAMARTILFLMELYPNINTIALHSEAGTTATACPGRHGRKWAKEFRAKVYGDKLRDVEDILRRLDNIGS